MKSVMIVDDDPAILDTVEIVLRRGGCKVVRTPSGTGCLELLRRGFRGVILMDIMMPELDGWQTIREMVREDMQEGNLICMMTAKTAPGTEGAGLEEHVFDYLPKPFAPMALLGMVENAASLLQP